MLSLCVTVGEWQLETMVSNCHFPIFTQTDSKLKPEFPTGGQKDVGKDMKMAQMANNSRSPAPWTLIKWKHSFSKTKWIGRESGKQESHSNVNPQELCSLNVSTEISCKRHFLNSKNVFCVCMTKSNFTLENWIILSNSHYFQFLFFPMFNFFQSLPSDNLCR